MEAACGEDERAIGGIFGGRELYLLVMNKIMVI
jgi:hypothetical protein